MERNILEESTDAVGIILGARGLDDVAVVVDVLALLLEHKALIELEENLVSGQKLHRLSHAVGGKDLGDQILRHLLRLRRKHAEGELAQLGGRVIEE